MTYYMMTTYSSSEQLDKISHWWAKLSEAGNMLVVRGRMFMTREEPLTAQELEAMKAEFPWDARIQSAVFSVLQDGKYRSLWTIENPDTPVGTTYYYVDEPTSEPPRQAASGPE